MRVALRLFWFACEMGRLLVFVVDDRYKRRYKPYH